MTAHARLYFERAPRYVLHPLDHSMMRFKGLNPDFDSIVAGDEPVSAKVVNLSESGLSFLMSGPELPEVDEVIMVEFTIPGRKQIACYANVVRIDRQLKTQSDWQPESSEDSVVRIAISFHKMPSPFKRALHASLKERVAPEEDFDDAADLSRTQRGFHFAFATVGLVMLFQTFQIPPHRLLQLFTHLFG